MLVFPIWVLFCVLGYITLFFGFVLFFRKNLKLGGRGNLSGLRVMQDYDQNIFLFKIVLNIITIFKKKISGPVSMLLIHYSI